MNRFLKFLTLALVLMSLGLTAFAQDVLPLPVAADESAPRGTIILDKPVIFGRIAPGSFLSWSNVGASSYTVKVFMFRTGQTVNWTPSYICAALCTTTNQPTDLFDIARNGDEITWSVTAKVNGVNFTSEARRAAVVEVEPPHLLTPGPYAQMARNQVTGFVWAKTTLAVKYTLFVKDVNSGLIVFKKVVTPASNCWDALPYGKCEVKFGGTNPTVQQVLKENRHYVWYVKVVGPTGEKGKSQTFNIFTKTDL